MNLFAKRNPEKRLRTQQIKAIVAELLELDQDVTVMVTELTSGRWLSGGGDCDRHLPPRAAEAPDHASFQH